MTISDKCVTTGSYYTGKDCIHSRKCNSSYDLENDALCPDGQFTDMKSFSGNTTACHLTKRPDKDVCGKVDLVLNSPRFWNMSIVLIFKRHLALLVAFLHAKS